MVNSFQQIAIGLMGSDVFIDFGHKKNRKALWLECYDVDFQPTGQAVKPLKYYHVTIMGSGFGFLDLIAL